MTDPTWEAVMRRNSNTPKRIITSDFPDCDTENHENSTAYVETGQTGLRNVLNNHHLLQDPCNDSGWMDFLQILVHQHAKTIVHLQELSAEVEKLKDFRSSFISSITGDLGKSSSAGPSDLHHPPKDVWTSPNKLIDSGFSTETKESGNQKEDEDPLYSLLDLIQIKVSNSTSTNSTHNNNSSSSTCNCSRVNNGTKQSANKLGKLDLVLGFKSGVGENVSLSKGVIKAILREVDTVELQRQLLFAAANIKTLESQLSSLEFEDKNSSRLASKYLALSHENELLRFKLTEQEIQLEGTRAKLRILKKNSISQGGVASLRLSLVPLDSLPKAVNASSGSNSLHSKANSHSSNEFPIQEPHPVSSNYCSIPSESSNEAGRSPNATATQFHHSSRICASPSTAVTLRNQAKNLTPSSSACLEKESLPALIQTPETVQLIQESNDRESIGTDQYQIESGQRSTSRSRSKVSRIPIRPQSTPDGVSGKKSTPLEILNPASPSPSQTQQSISSKSPGSSISSKSSIPVAVTRLKRVSNGTPVTAGRKQVSNFWASWFTATT